MAGIKLPIEKVRKRMVCFRCSDEEYQNVQAAASTADVPLSDWVRDTTLATARGTIAMSFPGTGRAVPEPAVPVSDGRVEEPLRPGDVVTMDVRYFPLWREVKIDQAPEAEPTGLRQLAEPIFVLGETSTEGELPSELPLSWADHWAQMERMEPGEATEKWMELAAGRKFPDGFPRWPKARKIEWLEATWPL